MRHLLRSVALGLLAAAIVIAPLAAVLWMMHASGGSYGGTP